MSAGQIELAIYGAAALCLASALVYLWSLPMQSVLWWGYSLFFLVIALAQGVYALILLRWPTQRVFLVGIWTGLALVLLYIAWYTEGILFGPHAGMVLHPDGPGMAGALAEAGSVVALVTLLEGKLRARTINALLILGAIIWIFELSGMLY